MTNGDLAQANVPAIQQTVPRRLAVFLPAVVFAGMAVLLGWGLTRNASDIPSALIGKPGDAARWLDTMGDPYTRTGADLNGHVAIDWGVYGVPETFVVTADGRIAYKHIGAVTEEALQKTILPLVKQLQAEAKGQQQ